MRAKEAAARFLEHRRVAVTGVSRDATKHGSNVVYKRLRERGYAVSAVNPNTDHVEGDRCYPSLAAVPGGVDAVVIATSAKYADGTMREAVELGITDVWMHRSFGPGSVPPSAAAYGRENGVTVIDGGCPLMYGETSDGGHRLMCRFLTLTGAVPRTV